MKSFPHHATSFRSLYLGFPASHLATLTNAETQHHNEKVPLPRRIRLPRIDRVRTVHRGPTPQKSQTEQTCSKDGKKASATSPSLPDVCAKGASASTDGKASCDKSKSAGCLLQRRFSVNGHQGRVPSKSASAGCCSKGASAEAGKKSKKGKKKSKDKLAKMSTADSNQ